MIGDASKTSTYATLEEALRASLRLSHEWGKVQVLVVKLPNQPVAYQGFVLDEYESHPKSDLEQIAIVEAP